MKARIRLQCYRSSGRRPVCVLRQFGQLRQAVAAVVCANLFRTRQVGPDARRARLHDHLYSLMPLSQNKWHYHKDVQSGHNTSVRFLALNPASGRAVLSAQVR